MRICFVNPYFYPYPGGIETRILHTGRNLVHRGHECYVLTSDLGSLPAYENVHGLHVIRLHSRLLVPYNPPPVAIRGGASSIYKALQRIDPDVVDFHYRWSPGFTVAMHYLMNNGGSAMVFTYHNMFGEGSGILRPLSFLNDAMISIHLKRYDALLCVSEYVKHDLVSRGFPRERIHVVPNGVDLSIAENRRITDEGYGLYVGRLVKTKGLYTLLRSLYLIKRRGITPWFKVAGDGPQMDRLRNLKRRLGLDSVEFLGHVTEEEKWDLYAGCRYLVLPSLFESFGMVLLEAMAFGKPVIATSAGGIPEVVGNGGVVVSPGDEEDLADAIMHVITTPELRSELSSKARERVRIFTWDHISLRLEKVYHECFVLARRRSMYDPSKLKEISIPTAAKDT